MDVTRDAIEKITQLVETKTFVVDGRTYSTAVLQPMKPPMAEAIKIHTLSGVVDFMKDADAAASKKQILVESPSLVKVIDAEVDAAWKTRIVHVIAETWPFDFQFGRYYDQKEFVIKLNTLFAEVADRDAA